MSATGDRAPEPSDDAGAIPGAEEPLIEMRAVSKRFGPTQALSDVTFAVHPGEVHALVGENGAGKSTLMKILSGAEDADSGTMRLAGASYRPRTPLEARRLGVAMIYQELSLVPHLSVEQNISLGLEPRRWGLIDRARATDRAVRSLTELGHGDIDPRRPVSELSISVRQVVEIARAVANGCRVLVLDEPTSSLTREDAQRLFALVRRLRGRGHAIVYISHFLEEVRDIADRFTVLRDGRTVRSGATRGHTPDDMVRLMVGRRIDELYPRSARVRGEPLLVVRGLRGTPLPVAADFVLHRGEVLGIAGLVGSGRTELLRAIYGLAPIASGAVRMAGVETASSPHARLAVGLGLLSENRKDEGLATNLPVRANITLSRLRGLGPAGLVLPARERRAAGRWIDRLGIRCRDADQPVAGLSGGNQQKVALARLLHHDVDVLLLDEPTRGIDVGSKAQIYALIDALAAGDPADGRAPRAVLMVSSYLPELLGICDRIAVMCRGVLGAPRPVAEWDQQSLMMAATGQT